MAESILSKLPTENPVLMPDPKIIIKSDKTRIGSFVIIISDVYNAVSYRICQDLINDLKNFKH